MTTDSTFAGKVALVSGSASGQGLVEVQKLAAAGAKVVVSDISDKGREIADSIGSAAIFVKHDVTKEDEWQAAIAATLKAFGKLDILINNAGVFRPASIEETSVELMDFHYRANQLGVFLGMKSVIPAMKAIGGGAIVNTSSLAGMRGYPGLIAYASTKWAVTGMTKAAAAELAPLKIRVNSLHPGLVKTPMLDFHTADALKGFEQAIPFGRMAMPEDVADMALYFASDKAAYITGQAVIIDGGMSI